MTTCRLMRTHSDRLQLRTWIDKPIVDRSADPGIRENVTVPVANYRMKRFLIDRGCNSPGHHGDEASLLGGSNRSRRGSRIGRSGAVLWQADRQPRLLQGNDLERVAGEGAAGPIEPEPSAVEATHVTPAPDGRGGTPQRAAATDRSASRLRLLGHRWSGCVREVIGLGFCWTGPQPPAQRCWSKKVRIRRQASSAEGWWWLKPVMASTGPRTGPAFIRLRKL
jgi:hypothetical protein